MSEFKLKRWSFAERAKTGMVTSAEIELLLEAARALSYIADSRIANGNPMWLLLADKAVAALREAEIL